MIFLSIHYRFYLVLCYEVLWHPQLSIKRTRMELIQGNPGKHPRTQRPSHEQTYESGHFCCLSWWALQNPCGRLHFLNQGQQPPRPRKDHKEGNNAGGLEVWGLVMAFIISPCGHHHCSVVSKSYRVSSVKAINFAFMAMHCRGERKELWFEKMTSCLWEAYQCSR